MGAVVQHWDERQAERIALLEEQNALYKAALARIAGKPSGVWGTIAHNALRAARRAAGEPFA